MRIAIRRPLRIAALLALSATLSCKDSGTGPKPTPSIVQLVSGNNQEATAGSELPNPLMVEVLDAKGNAVGGQRVEWSVTAGGGSVDPAASITNSSGIARTFFRLGTAAGENRATAKVGSLPPVAFVATGRARAAAQLVVVSGNGQTGPAGNQLPDPLVVRALDAQGQPMQGVTVGFTAAGGGQLSQAAVVTDGNGIASTRWTLGSSTGAQSVLASAGNVSAIFTATATTVQPSSRTLSIVSGNMQSATVSTSLGDLLVVRLLDGAGTPVEGATIGFTPESGTATPTSAITNANGEAQASWRLGTVAGEQRLTASASGASGVTFTATGTPGAPTQLSIVTGNSQIGNIGQPLPLPVVTAVADAFGNPVAGTTVTFSVTSGGGSITSSAVTDASGRASAVWTLGTTVGAQGAVANVPAIGNAAITATGTKPIVKLTHRVVDAEFDAPMNRIITVSANPSRLNIVDPESGATQSVDLAQIPAAVAVQPDGKYAAVGHNGWISYVNLTTLTVERVYSTTCDVLDVVLPGNGYVYAFPRVDQWVSIHTVQLSNGAETTASTIRAGTIVRLHPSGKYIYGANNGLSPSDFEKYDIRSGTATMMYDSPYHGDYAFSGNLWISDDGLRLFARSGNVFRSSEVRAEDMLYAGNLSGTSAVQWAVQPLTSGRVLVLPAGSWNATAAPELRVYGSDYLAYRGAVPLPKFIVAGSGAYSAEGQYVFTNAAASRVYVLVRADPNAGLAQDWGIAGYDMTEMP